MTHEAANGAARAGPLRERATLARMRLQSSYGRALRHLRIL